MEALKIGLVILFFAVAVWAPFLGGIFLIRVMACRKALKNLSLLAQEWQLQGSLVAPMKLMIHNILNLSLSGVSAQGRMTLMLQPKRFLSARSFIWPRTTLLVAPTQPYANSILVQSRSAFNPMKIDAQKIDFTHAVTTGDASIDKKIALFSPVPLQKLPSGPVFKKFLELACLRHRDVGTLLVKDGAFQYQQIYYPNKNRAVELLRVAQALSLEMMLG